MYEFERRELEAINRSSERARVALGTGFSLIAASFLIPHLPLNSLAELISQPPLSAEEVRSITVFNALGAGFSNAWFLGESINIIRKSMRCNFPGVFPGIHKIDPNFEYETTYREFLYSDDPDPEPRQNP